MNTLKETLAQRRGADLATPSVGSAAALPALLVSSWDGECWALSWSHLSGARWKAEADGAERLDLYFAHYHVMVAGKNLRTLRTDLAAHRLGHFRALPADYRRQADADDAFITRIEVVPLSPLPGTT